MKGSVKERRMCLFWFDFSSCSESAEIWHADSFCVKKCPCVFFFTSGETRLETRSWKSTPPPPLSNGVKHTHAQCFSSQRSKSYNVWRQTRGENALAVIGAWNRGYSLALVIFIIQVGPKWRAPWKGGVSTYLIAIFHAYSFCVKKCPCVFFFQESRKIWTKLHETLPPPPPPPPPPSPVSVSKHLEGVGKRAEVGGGGGGGWTFKSEFEALFPRLWKKEPRDIFWHKNRYIRLPLTEPFNCTPWGSWETIPYPCSNTTLYRKNTVFPPSTIPLPIPPSPPPYTLTKFESMCSNTMTSGIHFMMSGKLDWTMTPRLCGDPRCYQNDPRHWRTGRWWNV